MQTIIKHLPSYLSNSTIKPEIAHIYKKANKAIATDTYQLIEITLDDYLTAILADGYYSKSEWQALTKAYNKIKKDTDTITRLAKTPRPDNIREFPDYQRIIPKAEDLVPFNGQYNYQVKLFKNIIDVLTDATVQPKSKHPVIEWKHLKQNEKGMLYLKTEDVKALLMPVIN